MFFQDVFTKFKWAELWENWMAGKGSAHIFVYYQKPGKFIPETGDQEQNKNAKEEFFVTEGKFYYFVFLSNKFELILSKC